MPRRVIAASCCLFFSMLLGCEPPTPEAKLTRAIRMGRLAEVKQLKSDGLDVATKLDGGRTYLHVLAAAAIPSADVASFLIEEGVDVDTVDDDGKTAWDLAWNYQRRKITKRRAEFLIELLNAGFDPPRPTGENGSSFLHTLASTCQHAALVKQLANPAELESLDENGWTPLHYAAFRGNYEAADGLLLAGAAPNAETKITVSEMQWKGETRVYRFRYEAGSRPIDLYHKSHTRFTKDFRELIKKHGGTSNPNVDNKFEYR